MKKYYQSRTIWINFAILCLSLFDSEFFSMLGLSEQAVAITTSIIVKVVAILNIGLRLFTTTSIHGTSKQAE
jgi:hypothetical protein